MTHPTEYSTRVQKITEKFIHRAPKIVIIIFQKVIDTSVLKAYYKGSH